MLRSAFLGASSWAALAEPLNKRGEAVQAERSTAAPSSEAESRGSRSGGSRGAASAEGSAAARSAEEPSSSRPTTTRRGQWSRTMTGGVQEGEISWQDFASERSGSPDGSSASITAAMGTPYPKTIASPTPSLRAATSLGERRRGTERSASRSRPSARSTRTGHCIIQISDQSNTRRKLLRQPKRDKPPEAAVREGSSDRDELCSV